MDEYVDPVLWGAVADRLITIARSEWFTVTGVFVALDEAVEEMPDCAQKKAIQFHTVDGFSRASRDAHKWLILAMANRLLEEASAARSRNTHTMLKTTKGVVAAESTGPMIIPPRNPQPPGPDMHDPRLLGEAITTGRPDIGGV